MGIGTFISTERQAREAEDAIAEISRALSSEQVLKSIVEGLPEQVIAGLRRSLDTERKEGRHLIDAYEKARSGDFAPLKARAGSDLGAFLIAARIIRGFSQKDLARKLGLREQAIQRWEAERYRSISLLNYIKVAQTLGVKWQLDLTAQDSVWTPSYEVRREDLMKVVRHARENGWLEADDKGEENAVATLVRHVGDHVARYGTPSLLRTGLNVKDHSQDWSLLSWKAQVTRRAEAVAAASKPRFSLLNASWLLSLVQLSREPDGPIRAQELLLKNGIILIVEPQISGMSVDGAAFLVGDVPVIGLTVLRDTLDNFWFTLLHELGHIILHYRTGLSAGFFDDVSVPDVDDFEREANLFAQNLLIPDELWKISPARIAKGPEPIERLAKQLGINPAIIFGRIRMERGNYTIFSDKIGRGHVRKQFLVAEARSSV